MKRPYLCKNKCAKMNITFEEYKKLFRTFADGKEIPTTKSDFKTFQEHCLILEFLGYKEFPNTIFRRYDSEYDTIDEQLIERGLFYYTDPIDGKVWETDAHYFADDLTIDWKLIMDLWVKISEYEQFSSQLGDVFDNFICTEQFEIGRDYILMEVFKYRKDKGWDNIDIYYSHCEIGNCSSMLDVYYQTIIKFIQFINE